MALVEDWWFSVVLLDNPDAEPWQGLDWDADPDWEFRTAADDSPEELRRLLDEAIAAADQNIRQVLDAGGLDALSVRESHHAEEGRFSLRWILLHMIEEYARHNGHADLIRESIDGSPASDHPERHRRGLAADLADLRRDRAGRGDLRVPHGPHRRVRAGLVDGAAARADRGPRGGRPDPRDRQDGPEPSRSRRPHRHRVVHGRSRGAGSWRRARAGGVRRAVAPRRGLPRHPVQRGGGDQRRRRTPVAGPRLRDRRHGAGRLPLTRARVRRPARDVPVRWPERRELGRTAPAR